MFIANFTFRKHKNYAEALDYLREAEEKGILKDFFVSTWAKSEEEVDKKGWVSDIKKQLGGGK